MLRFDSVLIGGNLGFGILIAFMAITLYIHTRRARLALLIGEPRVFVPSLIALVVFSALQIGMIAKGDPMVMDVVATIALYFQIGFFAFLLVQGTLFVSQRPAKREVDRL